MKILVSALLVRMWRGRGRRPGTWKTNRSWTAWRLWTLVALSAAIDLLDTVAMDGSLGTWNEATGDVDWLIEQVEALQRKR